MYRVSFTGYRPEKLPFFGEDDPLCVDLKKRLNDQIRSLIKNGAEDFFSGMALGVDTWAAEAVLQLKDEFPQIRLNAVIPCPEQSDKWSVENRCRYNSILEQCSKKITISPQYSRGCMLKRNKALVELCDVLVAVFDGIKGGTMQTVNYAKEQHKRTILIPPI